MDIEELKKERAKAEEDIKNAINSILENFAKKTGLYISDVYLVSLTDVQEYDGHEMIKVESVSCNVPW